MSFRFNPLRPLTIAYPELRLPVFRQTKARFFLVIAFSDQSISIAQCCWQNCKTLTLTGQSQVIEKLDEFTKKEAIKILLKQLASPVEELIVSISNNQILVRQLSLPAQMSLYHVAQHVEAFVETLAQSLQTPLYYDYQLIKTPAASEYLWEIIAAKKTEIEAIKKKYKTFGLELNCVDVEKFALNRLVSLARKPLLLWFTKKYIFWIAQSELSVRNYETIAEVKKAINTWKIQQEERGMPFDYVISGAFEIWKNTTQIIEELTPFYQSCEQLFNCQIESKFLDEIHPLALALALHSYKK